MKKYIVIFAILFAFFLYQHNPELFQALSLPIEQEECVLEAKMTSEMLLKHQAKVLMPDKEHDFKKAELFYMPHLLVRFRTLNERAQVEENTGLWNLVSGELVLSSHTFESTNGFGPFIQAKLSRDEYRVLRFLGLAKGSYVLKAQVAEQLGLTGAILEELISGLRKKHLVVETEQAVAIFLENPKLVRFPKTELQAVSYKKILPSQKLHENFQAEDILDFCANIYNEQVKFLSTKRMYVPVIKITIQNPDMSHSDSYWNGVTGEPMNLSVYF